MLGRASAAEVEGTHASLLPELLLYKEAWVTAAQFLQTKPSGVAGDTDPRDHPI